MSTKDLVKSCIALYLCILLLGFVWAEAGAEERRIEVVGFDLAVSEVIFEDEDGFVWACPLGQHSWSLGEEYILELSEDGEINIRE